MIQKQIWRHFGIALAVTAIVALYLGFFGLRSTHSVSKSELVSFSSSSKLHEFLENVRIQLQQKDFSAVDSIPPFLRGVSSESDSAGRYWNFSCPELQEAVLIQQVAPLALSITCFKLVSSGPLLMNLKLRDAEKEREEQMAFLKSLQQ